MSIGHALIILCALGGISVKASVYFDFEDIDVEYLDPEYADVENSVCSVIENETGKNAILFNVTVLKSPPPDTSIHFKLTRMAMGKYITPTGIDMTDTLCDAMRDKRNLIGSVIESFGVDPDVCPPPPGNYFNAHYIPDSSNVPDDVPDGKYLGLFEMSISGNLMVRVNVYMDLQYE